MAMIRFRYAFENEEAEFAVNGDRITRLMPTSCAEWCKLFYEAGGSEQEVLVKGTLGGLVDYINPESEGVNDGRSSGFSA
jgi:hypothetical protein